MKRLFVMVGSFAAAMVHAQTDTTMVNTLDEVVVMAVKAQANAPFAVTNISGAELKNFSKTARELPFLFSRTPGVMAWSENGVGTGTCYMRIRGAGDSRINVTIDGMPLNSPEDQCVFWANMNSYSALLGGAQIQRGVGTSTNGDGAFGGTVQLTSKSPSLSPMAELTYSYGSYNTMNIGGSFSTGLIANHLVLDGAYHHTTTDGFIHGTDGKSGSYYGGVSYIGQNFVIRYKNIGNYENTGQAWNGVTAGSNDLSIMDGTFGASTGIKTYKDMWDKGLGRYNSLYESLSGDLSAGDYSTTRLTYKGGLWDKTTDNYWHDHNLLSAAFDVSEHWTTAATLRYTYGYGYYDELRPDCKLSKFGLPIFTLADGSKLKRTSMVRRKGLEENHYGFNWNANYSDADWNIVAGIGTQHFDGAHFGYVTYAENDELAAQLLQNGRYQYYDSRAEKTDNNVFVKAMRHLGNSFDVFADLQYRAVVYKTNGQNDKFIDLGDGTYENQRLDIDKAYDFFNPKFGMSFHNGSHSAHASVAVSHREPERNNFTDNGSYPAPKAEQLTDFELGYGFRTDRAFVALDAYYMAYRNQFVQTGELSDIGEALTTNIKDSYRTGLELTAGVNLTPWLSLEANAALSENKIKDFDEVVEDWDNGSQTIHYDNSTLAFSPSLIANGFVNIHHKGLSAEWHTGYVSRQYLDNTQNTDRSLPAFTVSNVSVRYDVPMKKRFCGLRGFTLGANLNNIFNARYAASGWVYSAIYESGGHSNDNRYYQIGFIPMAGFTAMGNVTLRF